MTESYSGPGISEAGKLELDARNCELDSCCSLEIDNMDISVYGGVVAWIIDKVSSNNTVSSS